MTTIEEATSDFERRGFEIFQHMPYKAPINDPAEIERINREIAERDARKTNSFFGPALQEYCYQQLEEQIYGQVEFLSAVKTFAVFRDLPEQTRPYLYGMFLPQRQKFFLQFMARNISKFDGHPLANTGRICLDFIGVDSERLEREIQRYVNRKKSNIGISPRVRFSGAGIAKIEVEPPYTLDITNPNLDVAYRDIASAIRLLGYDMKEL